MVRLGLLLCTFITLAACSAPRAEPMPTSPKLESIRLTQRRDLSIEMARYSLKLGSPIFIRAFKKEARLEVWVKDQKTNRFAPFKSYPICKYSGTLGPKLSEGDMQSPEGFYEITAEQLNPNSNHHLSFDLGFPNRYDQANHRTGSLLMIHGGCKSEGCYAMTDEVIEEIYIMVEASITGGANVPVHIFPFRMNTANMKTSYPLGWQPFWKNLKQGYDLFETNRIPPQNILKKRRYAFK